MKRHAFTLIELLIIVAIIAILTSVAMPFYENYVRDTKNAKAKHELDILKDALTKFDTFEDRKFNGTDLNVLLGKYLQALNRDPWGRNYLVNAEKGQVYSLGPDHLDPKDDLIIDYKPPLALQRAGWIDGNHDQHVGIGDLLRLEFSRIMVGSRSVSLTTNPLGAGDLLFSQEVKVGGADLVATTTISSSTEIYFAIVGTDSFFPGSSTVRVASSNVNLTDLSGRKANGTSGEFPGMEVTIQAN